ncbi:hypothetical protein TeGR_g7851 [Tetraparma gracilis]|uniref:Adenosine deaminase domain-containing protein n=1 Tax=Tetraparma gracilis TaxID=2962635 RepID=A0ABQ6MZM5_9STRA|nr:hypothetical protein TeGR_g7851 [Tetraparma gracilis]
MDLAGDEAANDNSAFVDCFQHTPRKESRRRDIRVATEDMRADRIGLGYAAVGDEELLDLIEERGVHLEACPGTALAERSIDAIGAFQERGLSMSLSEDDQPPFFGGCGYACVEAIAADCKGDGLSGSPAGRATAWPGGSSAGAGPA